MADLNRNPALDGIRAVACLAVVAFHLWPAESWVGRLGVQAFFVLSGYLVTNMIWPAQGADRFRYGAFILARVRRLWPPLAFMVATTTALIATIDPQRTTDLVVATVVALTFGCEAVRFFGRIAVFTHCWSLSVEMTLYLFAPAAIAMLSRLRRPARALWIAAAGLGALYWVLPGWRWAEINPFPFVVGAALAMSPPLPLHKFARALSWRPLVSLGLLSYGVYLWHPLALTLIEMISGEPRVVQLIMSLALSTLVAALSYLTIERWAGCAKAPLWPRRPPPAAALTEAAA